MIVASIEGMMLFVGYGKKRPAGAGEAEQEAIALCMRLAMDVSPLQVPWLTSGR